MRIILLERRTAGRPAGRASGSWTAHGEGGRCGVASRLQKPHARAALDSPPSAFTEPPASGMGRASALLPSWRRCAAWRNPGSQ